MASKMINRFGCLDGDTLDKSELLTRILGKPIDWVYFYQLKRGWEAFYRNPEKYEGTIVIDCINLWAEDMRKTIYV